MFCIDPHTVSQAIKCFIPLSINAPHTKHNYSGRVMVLLEVEPDQ